MHAVRLFLGAGRDLLRLRTVRLYPAPCGLSVLTRLVKATGGSGARPVAGHVRHFAARPLSRAEESRVTGRRGHRTLSPAAGREEEKVVRLSRAEAGERGRRVVAGYARPLAASRGESHGPGRLPCGHARARLLNS